ncbi:MAG: DUF3892 domain-containing protein [Candidatus Bathyarchaeia archaeon]
MRAPTHQKSRLDNMTEFEIVCIVEDQNHVITHVGLGPTGIRIGVQTVVDEIRGNKDSYYTNKGSKRARVHATQHPTSGRWFLTTVPDDTRANNLDFLPICPQT